MHSIARRITTAAGSCLLALHCSAADSDAQDSASTNNGEAAISTRLRYESARDDAVSDADALTLRTVLSLQSPRYSASNAWFATLELENTLALDGRDYSDGIRDRGTILIADPQGTEVNQLYLGYDSPGGFSAKLGRQTILLGDQRFIGALDFRQNNQSFDAFSLQYESLEDAQFFYAYVDNVNRIFGDDADSLPAGRLGDHEQSTHLLNAVYNGWSAGSLETYAYLIENDDFQRATTDTYGVRFSGSVRPKALTYLYTAEIAHQSNGGENPFDYETNYWRLSGGVSYKRISLQFTEEHLGSDNNNGFITPLATLHKFQGWADKFVALTPNEGLIDRFVTVAGRWPGVRYRVQYHDFDTDVGTRNIGTELDLQLRYRIGQKYLIEIQYADYQAEDGLPQPGSLNSDTQRAFLSFSMKFGSSVK